MELDLDPNYVNYDSQFLTVVVEVWLDIGDLNVGLLRVELGELHLLGILDNHQVVHSVLVTCKIETSTIIKLTPHKWKYLSRAGTGTRQRDLVEQVSKLLDFAFLLYSLWQLHLVTETLIVFEFFLFPEALLRCRVVVVAKIKNCSVPSLYGILRTDTGTV